MGRELKLEGVKKFLKDVKKYSIVTPEMEYFVKPELLEEPRI